ncbi:O-succinylbenzoic acid--CoA ligase [Marivirga lumbricoides]|uniref:O-succinylbenzoic acid--CoA ligase n=1 Tax=Marivirga lumbricoides TaxID=1046115 RepID=A0ABQ1N413_9BACT|nr:O-succinylbenzoic acid--CoA ligase [Marivirga lumbricoides]
MTHIDLQHWIKFEERKLAVSAIQDLAKLPLINNTEELVFELANKWLNGEEEFSQHSSGSTGKPKEIKIKRAQMEASAKATLQTLALNAGDTALLSISPKYIGGKMMVVRALLGSLNLIIGEVSGNPLKDISNEEKIDFFSFVPYQIDQIINHFPEGINLLNQSKAIILGGAPVSDALAHQIKEHINAPVYSTYGMTETVSHIALKHINANAEAHFKVLQNVMISTDERDCLVIEAEAITGIPQLVTNDIVKLYNKEEFEWLGRYDFVINSGGIKIHPEQVEKTLSEVFKQINSNNAFFVFGQPDSKFGSRLCLAIEGKVEEESIRPKFKENLAPYHQPKEIYFIPEFSYTGSGKINRNETLMNAGIDFTKQKPA